MELLADSLCVSCPYHTALFPGNAIHWPQLPCKFLFFSIKSSAGVYDCVSGNKWYVTRSLSEEGLHVIQSVLLMPNLKLHVTGLCHLPSCFAVSFGERDPRRSLRDKKDTWCFLSFTLFFIWHRIPFSLFPMASNREQQGNALHRQKLWFSQTGIVSPHPQRLLADSVF